MPVVKPPTGLGREGARIWRAVTSRYELRADEMLTLEDACRTSDLILELDAAWKAEGRPKTTKGSMGQKVIHPLIGEIRAQRAARNAFWKQLRLPDDVGGVPVNQAREAAHVSWQPSSARRRGA